MALAWLVVLFPPLLLALLLLLRLLRVAMVMAWSLTYGNGEGREGGNVRQCGGEHNDQTRLLSPCRARGVSVPLRSRCTVGVVLGAWLWVWLLLRDEPAGP